MFELEVTVSDIIGQGQGTNLIDTICIQISMVLMNLTGPESHTGRQDHTLVLSYSVTCA